MALESFVNILLEATPSDPKHLVTLQWVSDFVLGRGKMPVRLVSTSNLAGTYLPAPALTFTMTATGATDIDGVPVVVGNRVLFTGQTAAAHNGIYVVTTVGAGATHTVFTRADDFNTSAKIHSGVTVAVNQGDDHSGTFWKLVSDDPITLDTTALNWTSIEPPTGTQVYSETITGDGVDDEFDIEHELGTEDVVVQVYNNASHALVITDVKIEDDDTVTIGFANPPTATQVFKVVVIG
jgi:hypothetical protein